MRLTLLILGIFIMAVIASGFHEDFSPYRFRGSIVHPVNCSSRRRVMNFDSANCMYMPSNHMDPSV